jgi:hypothetical protein
MMAHSKRGEFHARLDRYRNTRIVTASCTGVGRERADISGKYATAYNEFCQANNPNNPTRGAGETYTQTVIATFDSKAGTVKIAGMSVTGPLIGDYVALSQTPISGAVSTSRANLAV